MNRQLSFSIFLIAGLCSCDAADDPSVMRPLSTAQSQTANTATSSLPLDQLPRYSPSRSYRPSVFARGNGVSIGSPVHVDGAYGGAGASSEGGAITLNFVNADIRDVIRSVMGETLRLNYTIDPQVQGQISLETSSPIPRSGVLPALENALRLSNIAVIRTDGIWRVLPIQSAGKLAPLRVGHSAGGYETHIIPLHWVSATDIQHALEGLLPAGTIVQADTDRNILIAAGTEQDLAAVDADVATFDVDSMKGMSFALIPLRTASARTVAAELPKVIGTESGPAAGIVHVIALERLNAVVVTSIQPAYVERARQWIDRLDQGTEGAARRLYVYRVQNGRAIDLSTTLVKALGLSESSASQSSAGSSGQGGLTSGPQGGSAEQSTAGHIDQAAAVPNGVPLNPLLGEVGAGGSAKDESIRITADEANNALLVYASPPEWGTVQAALAQLDIAPLQVLLEASIAEVTLTGQLTYGLQYFFNSGRFQLNNSQSGSGTIAGSFPGFNLLYSGGVNANIVLNLLSTLSNVKVLSSPDVLVLNNQKAHLQVGDEVPIATQSAVSTVAAGAPVVNSISYANTGVILDVTPRVNSSGLVSLDISQEVSSVSPTTSSSLNSPTIQERRVSSTVAVQDGQTIALAGLIQTTANRSDTGIPYLGDIPYLGFLFKSRSVTKSRTELVLLLTPHVVRNPESAVAITNELRAKFPLLTPTTSLRPYH